jgi:hypothetical protein
MSLPISTQVVYIRQGGSDTTGNGTPLYPYATISHAFSTITDASYTKRYEFDVGPGDWADNFSWKAWVFMKGSVVLATRLNGTIDINDPSWGIGGSHSDVRAGAQDISFRGTLSLDFSLQNSQYGKFYFWNCWMNNQVVGTGINPINQVIIQAGFWFGGLSLTGIALTQVGVSNQGGTITLNSSSSACSLTAFGGGSVGNLELKNTGGIAPTATLFDFPIMGTVSVDSGCTVTATNSSLPLNSNITNNGAINLLSDAYSISYSPSNPSDWNSPTPNTVQLAIDRLVSRLYVVGGNTPV